MADKATTLKDKLLRPRREEAVDWDKCGLSSGCTLLNLACSGRPDVAFLKGRYYPLVGDSGAGKTWILYQTMAEAVLNDNYKKHRLIADAPERGANMAVRRYFGGLADRLQVLDPPSATLEEFYDRLDALNKEKRPYILGLDSEDALVPEADLDKIKEDAAARAKARAKGKDAPDLGGSYGMARAKTNSQRLRVANNALDPLDSILFVIKQTRDKIGFGSQFNPKTKSGGNAITFYATVELWFSVRGDIRRKAKSKNRIVGRRIRVHVEKNRLSGRDRTVELHFYPDHGFDEIGTLVAFMADEGGWDSKKEQSGALLSVTAPDFDFEGDPEKLCQKIDEAPDGLAVLKRCVTDLWHDIEDSCRLVRKPRYNISPDK